MSDKNVIAEDEQKFQEYFQKEKNKVERKVYLSPVSKDSECFVNREMIETNQEMIIEKEECVPLAQIPLQKYLKVELTRRSQPVQKMKVKNEIGGWFMNGLKLIGIKGGADRSACWKTPESREKSRENKYPNGRQSQIAQSVRPKSLNFCGPGDIIVSDVNENSENLDKYPSRNFLNQNAPRSSSTPRSRFPSDTGTRKGGLLEACGSLTPNRKSYSPNIQRSSKWRKQSSDRNSGGPVRRDQCRTWQEKMDKSFPADNFYKNQTNDRTSCEKRFDELVKQNPYDFSISEAANSYKCKNNKDLVDRINRTTASKYIQGRGDSRYKSTKYTEDQDETLLFPEKSSKNVIAAGDLDQRDRDLVSEPKPVRSVEASLPVKLYPHKIGFQVRIGSSCLVK